MKQRLIHLRNRVPEPVQRLVKGVLVPLFHAESRIARGWSANAHHRLQLAQWGLAPQPEFYDHWIDVAYGWTASRNPLWLERGIFGGLALRGGRVLELACGDGFNAKHFYSLRSERVLACDFDPHAIRHAQQINRAPNVEFRVVDIRYGLPEGPVDNVVWDAAIEHFTRAEIDRILPEIRTRIGGSGIFSGYTVSEPDTAKALSHHETFFEAKEDLLGVLHPHFEHVTIFETRYPERHNLYWWASTGAPLPFGEGWAGAISAHRATVVIE